jgi:colanic acid biosynthesis glycosyl transferase WcaI
LCGKSKIVGKKILILTRYYPPEIGAAGVCVSEIAKRLVRNGHAVTVLTTVPNYPTGAIPPEYRGKLLQREVIEGVEVVRVWCYIAPNQGFLRRILAQLSFGVTAPLLGWRAVGQPDLVITGSPPLFNAIAGRILAAVKRCPHIFWIADLWPESAIQLGVLRNRFLIYLAERLEWSTYRHAQLVWVVSPSLFEILSSRGVDPQKLFLLPNGVDCEAFAPMPKAQARQALGWDERFTVIYAGGHGKYHGLFTLLDAAERLLGQADIHFVLVGDGAEKASLIAQAKQRGLTNITFLDALPHAKMPLLLNAADASLVHVRDIPLFRGMLPIKMYEGMACGRPMILAIDGTAQQWAQEEAAAAIHVKPEQPAELAGAIIQLRNQPALAFSMGLNGRRYVMERFDYQWLATALQERLLILLEDWQAQRLSALVTVKLEE